MDFHSHPTFWFCPIFRFVLGEWLLVNDIFLIPESKLELCLTLSFLFNFAVPPNIEDSLTSTDIVAREGSNVTLKCRATGSPVPSVKWKR